MKRMMPKALLLAIICLTISVGQIWGDNIAASIFNQGMQLYSQKDYQGAAVYLEQLCDIVPEHHQARYYLIYSYLTLQQTETAFKHANILCKMAPENQQFISLRDQIAQALSAHTASQPEPKPAIPKKESLTEVSNPEVRHKPGSSQLTPVKAKPMSDLESAIFAIDNEQFADAAKILDTILKKDPKNQSALHYRGITDFYQQQYSSAQTWFEKALTEKPNDYETLLLLGDVMFKKGKYKEAEEQFDKILKVRSNDVFAMLKLGNVKQRQGQQEAALKLFTQVHELDSSLIEARLALLEILIDRGQFDNVEKTVDDVLADDDSNYFAHYLKGRILFKDSCFTEAAREMRLALSKQPDDIKIKIWLAKSLLRTVDPNESIVNESFNLISQVLQVEPDNLDAKIVMAEVLIWQGRIDEACDYIDKLDDLSDALHLHIFTYTVSNVPRGETTQKVRRESYFLVKKDDGLWYISGEETPFTGIGYDEFSPGNIWYETPYFNGKKNGITILMNSYGMLKQAEVHVNGKLHGFMRAYCEGSGSLIYENIYIHGEPHKRITYSPKGEVVREEKFVDGCLQKSVK